MSHEHATMPSNSGWISALMPTLSTQRSPTRHEPQIRQDRRRRAAQPSSQRKLLKWTSAGTLNIQEGLGAPADIFPGATDHLDTLQNPLRTPLGARTAYDSGSAPYGPLVAWAATPATYSHLGVSGGLQDGFSAGEFEIELRVTADNLPRPLVKRWCVHLSLPQSDGRTLMSLTERPNR